MLGSGPWLEITPPDGVAFTRGQTSSKGIWLRTEPRYPTSGSRAREPSFRRSLERIGDLQISPTRQKIRPARNRRISLFFVRLASAFEVASIKPSSPDDSGYAIQTTGGEGLSVTNTPVRYLITFAYDISPSEAGLWPQTWPWSAGAGVNLGETGGIVLLMRTSGRF
jgi:hypothetical protein